MGATATVLAVISYCAWSMVKRRKKRFQFFLCHHKLGAGAYTRLLKLHLQDTTRREIFVDSDDLDDLDRLFDYVREDTETLAVLASREIFSRVWCLGEMVTAHMNHVAVHLVQLPDFASPEGQLITNCSAHVENFHCLVERGIGEELV